MAPGRGAREDEVGDVGAGDQQHEPDRAKQQPERPLGRRADHAVGERIRGDAQRGVRVGILAAQTRGDAVQLSTRGRERCRRGQPAEHDERVTAAAPRVQPLRPGEVERLPYLHVGGRQLELRRHHADDFDGRLVELNRLADNAAIAAEPLAPQSVGDDDHPAGL